MAMEIVGKNTNKKELVTKTMGEMGRGEVCYSLDSNRYLVKIISIKAGKIDPVFLFLDDDEDISFCVGNDFFGDTVRELYPGESITIKFS